MGEKEAGGEGDGRLDELDEHEAGVHWKFNVFEKITLRHIWLTHFLKSVSIPHRLKHCGEFVSRLIVKSGCGESRDKSYIEDSPEDSDVDRSRKKHDGTGKQSEHDSY